MTQQVDARTKGFTSAGTFSRFARVKVDANGDVVEAALADKEIGIAQLESFAAGDRIPVKLRTADGTCKMIAAEALAAGAAVYTAASGKVADTAAVGSFLVGTALEAAAADGDIIEVVYNAHGDTAN